LRQRYFGVIAYAIALLLIPFSGTAVMTQSAHAEGAVIEDVLGILKERGIVDEEQYSELHAKNKSYEKNQSKLLGKIELSGDFRARHESTWYDTVGNATEPPDSNRIRYRFRLNGKAKVNDRLSVGFQVGTGEARRSRNMTLGDSGDWTSNSFSIHRAFLTMKLPTSVLKTSATFGKQENPFNWEIGKSDMLMWDRDIGPEGIGLKISADPSENFAMFMNAGYFIVDENSVSKDPHVFGVQIGGETDLSKKMKLGARGSFYNHRSVDSTYRALHTYFGNIDNGFNGGTNKNEMSFAEFTLYSKIELTEYWPILIWGSLVKNLDAKKVGSVDKEDGAFGLGFEVSSKKHIAKLGLGYFEIEANAVPAAFMDSNLLGGQTNREGFVVYGSKQILKNTDLGLTLFVGEEIEDEPGFASRADADKMRLQADINVKF